MRRERNLTTLFCSVLAICATAQASGVRFAISPNRVAEALAAAGVPVTTEQVKLLSPVSARDRDPSLRVMKVTKWTDNTFKAELRCRDQQACLPFYVLLTGNEKADTHADSGLQQKVSNFVVPGTPALLRDGDSATLVFENSALRITLPVICLQSGNRGETIRVESKDHRRFFNAQIIAPGLLKAAL
ncbi:MAG TPA: flagella basal body P-ring formation protein FlgA [Terriglobales bacterium]|nr:flagella basal body P-ring formation protein FlgA [Terriglobales bacterium]